MKQIIGFATQFYTLWNYSQEKTFTTDSYGNHHCTGVKHIYEYVKNISKSIEKVNSLYPNVIIDDSLRGKTHSFDRFEKRALPENIFWGGKYAGKLVDEILVSDFQYCLWSAENYGGKTSQYIKNHPTYLAYVEAQDKDRLQKINDAQLVKVGDVVELEFTRNGYNLTDDSKGCTTDAVLGDTKIICFCSGAKVVGGLYPYLMPEINGKVQKTKGKKIVVTVLEVLATDIENDIIYQRIKIK